MIIQVRFKSSPALSQGQFPLFIASERPILLGGLAEAQDTHGRNGLLFVYGHEDGSPPHKSTTGDFPDMPLDLALGPTITSLEELAVLLPLVSPPDTIVIGLHDLDELAAANIRSLAANLTCRVTQV